MASPRASSSSIPEHPFANSKNLLEIIPDKIDIEEESRLYDELAYDNEHESRPMSSMPKSFQGPPSIFSKDIWMDDKTGEALAFARDVSIGGWTNVGDKPEGAYIVYDCTIQTKEGTVIHAHKRYRDFAVLESALRHTLPAHQRHFIPVLPPKTPLSRYRPAFLDRRRRRLQAWLSAVLLHPDVGGAPAVRLWVMN